MQPEKINFEIDFCKLKTHIVALDFYNLSFQKSGKDQQGESVLSSDNPACRKCPGAVCFAIFNLFYFFVQKSLAIKHTKAIVAQLCNF